MAKYFHLSGLMVAGTLALAGCAVALPVAQPVAQTTVTHSYTQAQPGSVTVPVAMPAIADRSAQYLYDKSYINTVEVRLRDSLGNESVQYVARNSYLAGSAAAGTINLTFLNVMPGTFTLTVRTSHKTLVGVTSTIKYDGIRDVFFADNNSDNIFNGGDVEVPPISGNKSSNFLVFGADFSNVIFTGGDLSDGTNTTAGFGLGGATGSITSGQTSTVAATVSQAPRWAATTTTTVREVTAGDVVSLGYNAGDGVLANDQLLVAENSGNGFQWADNGLIGFNRTNLNYYGATVDTTAATVSFAPTRATSANFFTAPTAWLVYFARGAAVSEAGMINQPTLVVWPDLVNAAHSRLFADSQSGTTNFYYDLRDKYDNLVLGNVAGVNQMSGTLRRANIGITAPDYCVTQYSYGIDSTAATTLKNSYPFLVPGRTAGKVNGSQYTQGTTPAGMFTVGATYSVNPGASAIRVTRLEVPYVTYASNPGAFASNTPTYTLGVVADPTSNSGNLWVSLACGATTIASASVTSSQTGNISLSYIPGTALGKLPGPVQTAPVVLNTASAIALSDDGTQFNVSSLGTRRINDTDTVRVRVLNNQADSAPFMFQDFPVILK